uniref:NADH-ubiquinone oxidoreductase chain 2 n=1 Tax=Ophiuroglypha kinbergi TaxID=3253740 RepID=A0A7G9M4U5_9ECHI|nr:NADH dehydrogenase subunit 2 [Ophiura kinbergi]QNN00532.1 NADH dehydrogenase subunit 2 [Ophiura kinbergi]
MNSILLYTGTLIFSTVGCFTSKNWLVIWFWIELNSLALIPIISSNVNSRSIESTTKYFLFQAIGSVVLLLGVLLRLFVNGTILIEGDYSVFSISIIIVAVALKMGIFPNHYWFVDVMQGVNLMTGFFLSIISKIVPLYVIIVISNSSNSILYLFIGTISVIVGSSFGIQQTQLRKLIALSSVAHLGWMIILFSTTHNGTLGALIFVSYILMTLPLFWIGNKFSLENLSKTSSVNIMSTVSLLMIISILSMAGFPPLLGFFYKWVMLSFISNNGNYLVVFLLIGASLLSLFFYIQLCISFYFNIWPKTKTLLVSEYFSHQSIFFFTSIVILSNVLVCLAVWYLPILSVNWSI